MTGHNSPDSITVIIWTQFCFDGIAWWRYQMETFSALLALCVGNSPFPVNSPHKGQWRGALMFSLICVWINGWVNSREAGDLRRYRVHYDVSVMAKNGIDAFTPGSWDCNLELVIFLLISRRDILCRHLLCGECHKTKLMDCQATSHYLSQCWPRSMKQYQWVSARRM